MTVSSVIDSNAAYVRLEREVALLLRRSRAIQGRLAGEPQLYWLNQYANPSNWAAHEQHTAPAVLKAFPTVDHLFLGVGTGGTLMGCVNHFRLHSPHTRIVAVLSVVCVLLL